MRTLFFIKDLFVCCLMFATAIICFSGCEKVNEGIDDSVVDDGSDTTDFTDPVVIPELILDNDKVEVPVYGGNYEISYEIENQSDSLKIEALSLDAWVNQLDISVDGKISFNVDQAEGVETRSTDIIVSYGEVEEVITVTQHSSVNSISMSVTNIADTAEYEISTTVDDGYLMCLRRAEDYKLYDDRQLLIKLLGEEGVSDELLNGSQSGVLRDLDYKTDYIMIAFGYEDGFATTMPFKKEFTTPRILDVNVECKYFDGSALYESNPVTEYEQYWGKVVLVMTAEPMGDCTEYYYSLLTPYMAGQEDNMIINNLKTSGYTESRTVQVLPSVYYGTTQTVAYIAFDDDGNSGSLHKYGLTFSKDGVSPVDEF